MADNTEMATASSNGLITFEDTGKRNSYSLKEIRWTGFVFADGLISMAVRLVGADGPVANSDSSLVHAWDDGGRGPSMGAVWWVARSGSEPLSFGSLSEKTFQLDCFDEPDSIRFIDSYPGVQYEDDLCVNLYWRSTHEEVHSTKLSLEEGSSVFRRRLNMQGVVGYALCSATGWKTTRDFDFHVDTVVEFDGFDVPQGIGDSAAWETLRQSCIEADQFELVPNPNTSSIVKFPKRFVRANRGR